MIDLKCCIWSVDNMRWKAITGSSHEARDDRASSLCPANSVRADFESNWRSWICSCSHKASTTPVNPFIFLENVSTCVSMSLLLCYLLFCSLERCVDKCRYRLREGINDRLPCDGIDDCTRDTFLCVTWDATPPQRMYLKRLEFDHVMHEVYT